jgi:hypothetical protein
MVHVASGANESEIRHPQLDAQLESYSLRHPCPAHPARFRIRCSNPAQAGKLTLQGLSFQIVIATIVNTSTQINVITNATVTRLPVGLRAVLGPIPTGRNEAALQSEASPALRHQAAGNFWRVRPAARQELLPHLRATTLAHQVRHRQSLAATDDGDDRTI